MRIAPQWRKVLRDLSDNKLRTVLVVLAIAVGVFAFGVVATARVVLARELATVYRGSNPFTAELSVSAFDDDLVDYVAGLREVKEAQGRHQVIVSVQVGPDDWDTMFLYAIDDYNDIQINQFSLEPGVESFPPARREVLLERSNYNVPAFPQTDTLLIEMPDGQEKELLVTGLVHDINLFPAQFYSEGYGFISFETLEWLDGSTGYNRLYIVLEDATDTDEVEATMTTIRERIEEDGYVVNGAQIPQDGKHWASDGISAIAVTLGAIGGFCLILCAFLVVNTISSILTQQVRQIGMMKTVGALSKDVTEIYMAVVLAFGLMSLFVAIPLGIFGAQWFTGYVAQLMNFDVPRFAPPLWVMALQAVIGLAVPPLAGAVPIFRGTRMTAYDAIYSADIADAQARMSGFDQLIDRLKGLPRPLMLSLRNTFRRKARLFLTVGTLTVAGGVFISIFTVRAGLIRQFDEVFGLLSYDVSVDFVTQYRSELLVREAHRMDGVIYAEAWNFGNAQHIRSDGSEGPNIFLAGVPPDSQYIIPTLIEGRWLLPGEEGAVVITADMSITDPDLYLGGSMDLKVDENEETFEIVGILRPVGDPNIDGFAYIVQEDYQNKFGDLGYSDRVIVETTNHTIGYQSLMARELREHFTDVGLEVGRTTSVGAFRQGLTGVIGILITIFFMMAILLAVVGGLGLAGTMSLNVLERTREIGVMRAVGASNAAVYGIVIAEGIIISLMSCILGAIVAIPIGYLLSILVGNAFNGMPLDFVYSLVGVGAWLVLALLIALIASVLPALRAASISVRESLAYE